MVLFWCLCLTLWRVKYCQGWSSVRFVTLLPRTPQSESHIQRYFGHFASQPWIRPHCLPHTAFLNIQLRSLSLLYFSGKPVNYLKDLDNFISLTVCTFLAVAKYPLRLLEFIKSFSRFFFLHFYLSFSGLS